jgi:hypothetical protein
LRSRWATASSRASGDPAFGRADRARAELVERFAVLRLAVVDRADFALVDRVDFALVDRPDFALVDRARLAPPEPDLDAPLPLDPPLLACGTGFS